MQTPHGHLTYCSNIHPGEKWHDHFSALRTSVPLIRQQLSPDAPFGLGVRIAGLASKDLHRDGGLSAFRDWLSENNTYVFTLNGFPYGGFHNTRVKQDVHAPDWVQPERRDYTIRLFRVLSQLLPDGLDGGVSTSPLSYRHWWQTETSRKEAVAVATHHILEVVVELLDIRRKTGQVLHLDIEPEPDGILENSIEFVDWFKDELLFRGVPYLIQKKGLSEAEAEEALRTHVQVCYDVCHFAVEFEDPDVVLDRLEATGIGVGKIQISSALKVDFGNDVPEKVELLRRFDEPVYLHQVVAQSDATQLKFPDLDAALWNSTPSGEWRIHYHVPLFVDQYGLLKSTRDEIVRVLNRQKTQPFTRHLEVETYTWGVLPPESQLPIEESIVREMTWVKEQLL